MALLVVGMIAVAVLLAILVVVRRMIPLERLRQNNEVGGIKYGAIGGVYGLLQAFVVFAVWQNYRAAEESGLREASALLTVDALSRQLPEPHGRELRAALSGYAQAVRAHEWPALARRERSPETILSAHRMVRSAIAFEPATAGQGNIQSAIIAETVKATEHRRERLNAGEVDVPGILWFALGTAAFVAIAFTFFFGSPNLRAQSAQLALLSAVIVVVLFVTAALDRPFAGPAALSPRAFDEVLQTMRERDQPPRSAR